MLGSCVLRRGGRFASRIGLAFGTSHDKGQHRQKERAAIR